MNFFEFLKRRSFFGNLKPITWLWVRDSTGRYLYDSDGVKIVVGVR